MRTGLLSAIISAFFLLGIGQAQTPTGVRTVTALPSTCRGGTAGVATDKVVLVTGGVGAEYTCTAPNTWTADSSAGSTIPGILLATSYSGADVCAQITNAIAALPSTGGTIQVPAGNFSACAGSGGIGIVIDKKNVILRGAGSGSPMGNETGATTINSAAGVTGIDITESKVTVEDLFLMSASTGTGTDDGIRIRSGSVTVMRVGIEHFGRNGIRVDGGNTGGSADLWHMEDVEATYNYGDGMHWASPCTDNHLGTGIQLNSSLNGGWGYYIDCGSANHFITTHATQNTLGGAYIGASWNNFANAYFESGVGSSFVIASGLTGVNASFQAFGQPTTITNPGATAAGNHIHYYGVDNWPVQNGLFLGGQPGTAGNKTYMLQVGGDNGSQLGMFDYTDAASVFVYDPTTKWQFGQKVTYTPDATLAGVNLGTYAGDPSSVTNGDTWYNSTTNKFRCRENGATANCIGASTGSVTHTTGGLTAGKVALGGGDDDLAVDPNFGTDGAGNATAASYETSGTNGGVSITEGTGVNCHTTGGGTGATGKACLWNDSTTHRLEMNNNNGGAATVMSTSDAVAFAQLPAASKVRACDISLGDGENAITAGTYNALVGCKNDTGATVIISGVECYTDAGTSTCDATTSHSGTPDILTGAVTGTTAFAAGTQSATTTILTGEWITASLVADGTTKRIVLHIIGTL